jgi:hypothetical protein
VVNSPEKVAFHGLYSNLGAKVPTVSDFVERVVSKVFQKRQMLIFFRHYLTTSLLVLETTLNLFSSAAKSLVMRSTKNMSSLTNKTKMT